MILGVISDIHGLLPDKAREALAGCDAILCAGDTESIKTIWDLETIAPVTAIQGNCDRYSGVQDLPALVSPKFAGVRFRMVHRPQDIGSVPDDVQVVVHGHTHVPRNQTIRGVLYINPGSTTYPRSGSDRSIARITVEDGAVLGVEFVSW